MQLLPRAKSRSRAVASLAVAALIFWVPGINLVNLCIAATGAHNHPKPVVLAPGYGPLDFVPPPAGQYALPPMGYAADGPVLNTNGQVGRLRDYLGEKITVLSFIYTTCNDVNGCPLATFVLKGVQDKVQADPHLQNQVRLVSFSFDPQHDTPEVLDDYRGNFAAANFDWQFLTTQDEASLDPTLEAYGQWVVRDFDAEGNYLGTMSHILRVFLIDKQQRIRNIYSTSFLHADTVANDIRTLLMEEDLEQGG